MESSYYLVIFIAIILHNTTSSKCACLYKLSRSYSHYQPIYFIKNAKKSFILATPKLVGKDRMIEIQDSEKLLVTCPYHLSTPARHYKEEFFISCKNETMSISPTEDHPEKVNPDHYKCKNKVGFTFRYIKNKKVNKQCDTVNGRLYYVGIYVNFKSKGLTQKLGRMFTHEIQTTLNFDWYTIYLSCYQKGAMNPLYTMYTLDGKSLSHRQHRTLRWNISNVDIFNLGTQDADFTIIPLTYNRKFAWENTLSKIPNFHPNDYFDVERKNIVTGLLVPENDMPFLAWKHATTLPHNIAPMWQQVVCSWKNIERVVKSAAIKLETELEIYTGIYGRMKLPNLIGHNVIINLFKNSTTVIPEFFWKLVYYKDKKQAIVFVLCNNPYKIFKDPDPDELCPKKKCSDYGWPVDNNILRLGKVYCCTAHDLFKSMKDFEIFKTYLDIEGILEKSSPTADADTNTQG